MQGKLRLKEETGFLEPGKSRTAKLRLWSKFLQLTFSQVQKFQYSFLVLSRARRAQLVCYVMLCLLDLWRRFPPKHLGGHVPT